MLWKHVKQSQTLSLIMHVDFTASNEATCGGNVAAELCFRASGCEVISEATENLP